MNEQIKKLEKAIEEVNEMRKEIEKAKVFSGFIRSSSCINHVVEMNYKRFTIRTDADAVTIAKAVEEIVKRRESELEPIERKLETLSELID